MEMGNRFLRLGCEVVGGHDVLGELTRQLRNQMSCERRGEADSLGVRPEPAEL